VGDRSGRALILGWRRKRLAEPPRGLESSDATANPDLELRQAALPLHKAVQSLLQHHLSP
jgi:hypothetical protein